MKFGRRVAFKSFILFIQQNKNTFHRLGIVVKKEVGPATFRNRMKRYIREFFRLHKHLIRGSFDIVLLVKKGCLINRYKEVEEELRGFFIRWTKEQLTGWLEEDSSYYIFINTRFHSSLGLAAVLLLPAPLMRSCQSNVSEWWRGSGLPLKDSLSAILSIQADTIRFLKSSRRVKSTTKILRKEI